jgi:hypothetical protein
MAMAYSLYDFVGDFIHRQQLQVFGCDFWTIGRHGG